MRANLPKLIFLFFFIFYLNLIFGQDLKFKEIGRLDKVRTSFTEILENSESSRKYLKPLYKVPKNPTNSIKPSSLNVISRSKQDQIRGEEFTEQSPEPEKVITGVKDPLNAIPPDTHGAVGLDHILSTLNTNVQIMDREGKEISIVSLTDFFSPLGATQTFDPRVLFDERAKRWIIVVCTKPSVENSGIYIAISENHNPTANWDMYYIPSDREKKLWLDYPSVGLSKDFIVITGNMFGKNNNYKYSKIIAIRVSEIYDHKDVIVEEVNVFEDFSISPAVVKSDDKRIYMANTLGTKDDIRGHIRLRYLEETEDNIYLRTIGDVELSPGWLNNPGDNRNFLPQKGSTELVNGNDTRMRNLIQKGGKLFGVFSAWVFEGNSIRQLVRWYVIDVSNEEYTVVQDSEIRDNIQHYGFPSIAVNDNEDIMIGFSVFSEEMYPAAGYIIHKKEDPKNSFRKPFIFQEGKSAYYKTFGSNRNRWGDYSATVVDPRDKVNFWTYQEYADRSEDDVSKWATTWAKVNPNEKLEAAFTSKSTIVLKGKSVDFINKSLGNPDGYKWTFQGGLPSISTAKNPQGIVYNVAGEYDVKLSVYKDGVFDRTMKENYIVVPETSDLMAAFDVSNKYSCPKGEVILINKSIGDYDKIEWTITPDTYEFVEGYDRHSRNAKVKLLEQDNYIVKLKVSNEYVTDEISKFAVEVNTEDSVFDLLNEDFDDDIDGVWHSNDTAFNWKQVRYDINNKTKTLLEYIIPENEKKKQHSLIFPAYYYHGTSFDINMGLDYAYGVQEGYVNDNTVELYYSMDCGNSWELVSDNILDLDNNKSYETTFVPSSLNSKVITSIPKTIGRYVFKIVIKGNTPSTFLLNKIWLDVEDGVEIIENNSIEVYPNLTKGIINIILNEKVDNDKIEICNILGRPLIIIKVDQLKVCKRVDISSFLKGMYFVRYMKENKAYSKKIIKE